MSDQDVEISVLFVGVDTMIVDYVNTILCPTVSRKVSSIEDFLALLESSELASFHFVFAGPLLGQISIVELAQSIRGILRRAPIFYCHTTREYDFDVKDFQKNGFTEVYLFPFDQHTLKSNLEECLAKLKSMPVFRSVRVVDIEPEQKLGFDLHILLPLNGKYIQMSSAGQSIDQKRIDKLKNHKVGSIFVPLNQMEKFYEYTADKLKELGDNSSGMSETEQRERLQSAVRNLMGGIFSKSKEVAFSEGKKVLEDTNKIIRAYVTKKSKGSLHEQLLCRIDSIAGTYSHISNVSTFAALFSMATGIGEPEELALAGMFHDIGLSAIPPEIQAKKPEEWTPEERQIYEKHPEHSLNLIKDKRLSVSDNIQTMILQHHERINSKGYPLGISEPKLRIESQLLGLADVFDELIRIETGKAAMSPEQAFQKIREYGEFSNSLLDHLTSSLKENLDAA